LGRWGRLTYRLYRHPLVLFGVGPTLYFCLAQRWPYATPRSWRREWRSVYGTNLALLAILGLMGLTIGIRPFLLIELPILAVALTVGMWLFYVQHQFEHTYWAPADQWEYAMSALHGSSYYKLPRLLQWVTGNIGLHHIHHLNPRIPNYYLQACHDAHPLFQTVAPLTLWQSLQTVSLTLWDEDQQKLVGFRALKTIRDQG
jgi:omega-6 fatty acid desaturase (delta-12 desaturase)